MTPGHFVAAGGHPWEFSFTFLSGRANTTARLYVHYQSSPFTSSDIGFCAPIRVPTCQILHLFSMLLLMIVLIIITMALVLSRPSQSSTILNSRRPFANGTAETEIDLVDFRRPLEFSSRPESLGTPVIEYVIICHACGFYPAYGFGAFVSCCSPKVRQSSLKR